MIIEMDVTPEVIQSIGEDLSANGKSGKSLDIFQPLTSEFLRDLIHITAKKCIELQIGTDEMNDVVQNAKRSIYE